jgi:hypothetical protein
MNLALELLRLAVVGLIAGLFAAALSYREHRERKWWELRVAAYQNAIEALSDLIYCYDKRYHAEIEYRELPKEFDKRISAQVREAFPKVRRFADSGAFLFSDAANAALKEFVTMEDTDDYIENLDSAVTKAKKCLATLIECSKTDLRLKRDWWHRWV